MKTLFNSQYTKHKKRNRLVFAHFFEVFARFFEVFAHFFEVFTRFFEVFTRFFEVFARLFEVFARFFEVFARFFEVFTRLFEVFARLFEVFARLFEQLFNRLSLSRISFHSNPRLNCFYPSTLEKQRCHCERNAVKRSKLYAQRRIFLGSAST